MEKNVKRKIRFLLPVLFACLMAFSGIFVPTFNGSTTGLENKNVLFQAEGTNTLLENTTLTEIGEGNYRAVVRNDTLVFGNTGKDTNGYDVPNAKNKAEVVNALAGAQSPGKGLIYRFHTWTNTIGTNACATAVVFKNPVDLDIVSSITLRLYLHLSAGEEFYATDPYGYDFMYLYGLGDTGENNSGYAVYRKTQQKQWIDLKIEGDKLARLATKTEDGGYQLKGLQVGFRARSNNNNVLYTGSPSELNAFVVLDYITYEVNEPVKHYKDVTKNGSTLLATASDSSQVVGGSLTTVHSSQTNYNIGNIESAGSYNGTVWKQIFHSGVAVNGGALQFAKSVAKSDIESVTIRMNAHFSASQTYYTANGGVMFTALETITTNAGSARNVHTIVANVQQDAWIDYTISGSELNYLADTNGNINGIQIAAFIVRENNDEFYIGGGSDNKSWLLIDYIYYTPKYKANFEYEGAAITELESYTTAEKVVLPNFTQDADEVFVGWKQVVGNETYLYRAGEEITLTANTTFAAVTVDFDMIKGASIRVGDDAADSGIRFACTIDAADYAALGNFAQGFGTMILPTESLAQKDFVMENFDSAKNEILIIEGVNFDDETIPGYTLYTGVMVNIKQHNYAEEFSARGYIKIAYTNGDVGYIYTDYNATNNSRSISSVAQKILDSGNSEYADVQIIKDYAAAAN